MYSSRQPSPLVHEGHACCRASLNVGFSGFISRRTQSELIRSRYAFNENENSELVVFHDS